MPGFIVVCPHCETILGAIADPDYLAKRAAQMALDSRTPSASRFRRT
jgi:hypothetical protein